MAVDFLGALGVGSGLDSKNLVESLVAAERAPTESRLNSKIAASEQQISAYGTVMSSLQALETAFGDLNDVSEFSNYSTSISGAFSASGGSSFEVTTSTGVEAGRHEISVTHIAEPDRWVSAGLAATDTELNSGNPFTLTLDIDDVSVTDIDIDVETATPQGVVDAINASGSGFSASLVDTGSSSDPYKIVITGPLGVDNSFTVDASDITTGTSLTFPDQASDAKDAMVVIDGVTVTRATNSIDDLIDGVTLDLLAPSVSSGVLQISADTQVVEDRIRNLVDTYNAVRTVFDTLRNPDADDELAGALSGDNSFRTIENRLREMFTSASSTPGTSLTYLSDIGVEMTRYGTLEIDDTKLSDALTTNYADVVTMFSADTERQSMRGDLDRGIAGDALVTLATLMDTDGPIRARTDLAETRISSYEADLADLDLRMQAIYDRYLKQFTAMESIVDQMNSTRDYLKQQIDALPFNNRNN
jgi:flagellar hook-associated protein 2